MAAEISAEIAKLFDLDWWTKIYHENPARIFFEFGLIAVVLWSVFRRSYDPKEQRKLSKNQEDKVIAEWFPEPLAPETKEEKYSPKELVLESATGPIVTCNGKKMLNFASSDFLGLAAHKEAKSRCAETVEKYGVGSCGPRGFYGTIDVHLKLEDAIAKFYETEECILYSDGIACVASVISTYARRGDLIVCDEAAYYGIQQGIYLSRCNVLYFKHNDMEDLKRILDEVQEKDRKRPPTKLNRRFIVVEGIYQNAGDICPLDIVVDYVKRYKYRLILDDTLGIGVLGATGKGTPEHFKISTATAKSSPLKRTVNTIELICGNMETSLGTVGGFCVGSAEVIDHQRLHGLGYCFSASAPPYTCTAGIINLGYMKKDLAVKVRTNANFLRKALASIPGVIVVGSDKGLNKDSPTIFLRINHSSSSSSFSNSFVIGSPLDGNIVNDWRRKDEAILQSIAAELLDQNIIIYYPHYVPSEREQPWPSLRIFVTSEHTNEQLKQVVTQLTKSFSRHFSPPSPSISTTTITSSEPSSPKKSISSNTTTKRRGNEEKKRKE